MKTILLVALQLAASGSDAYFTHRNELTPKFREHNPLVAPFVGSTHGQVIFFGAGAALKVGGAHLLRRHHPRLADSLAVAGIADNAFGAAFSATH
jgi:hypothetical protein